MKATVSRFGVGVVLALGLCLGLAASSSAQVSFCMFGTDPGQCRDPAGVAVNHAAGTVYVADSSNNRVNAFAADGTFLFSFGSAGSGPGEFTNPRRVAVDNDPTSPSFQNVYVADSHKRVQRFSPTGTFELTVGAGQLVRSNPPIAVGPAGDLYAIDISGSESVLKIFAPNAVTPTGTSALGAQAGAEVPVDDVAVDSGGDVYITAPLEIEKYDPTEPNATLLNSFGVGITTTALALGGDGSLYAAQRRGPAFITKYDSSTAVVKRFGYEEIRLNLQGLAADAQGTVYGSEEFVAGNPTLGNKVVQILQPPPGALPCCLAFTPGTTKATLEGQVNPEGKAATYHFDYISHEDYVANGNSFTGAKPFSSTPESSPVGSDFELHEAKTTVGCTAPINPPQAECLKPSTAYHARLVATNADGSNEKEGSFETLPPFEVKGTWATDVGTDAAKIHASINPQEIPATAFFEYVDDANFKASGFANATKAPQTPIDLGGGSADVRIEASLGSLSPGSAYHYRVVVADLFVPAGKPGPEKVFGTYPLATPPPACANDVFRVGLSSFLPNCRAYEMVSPIDKNGGDIRVLVNIIEFPTRLDQSAGDGDSFTYTAVPAFANPKSAPFVSQYMARRSAAGWASEAINPPRESVPLTDQYVRLDAQYKIFSPDLASGWLAQDANPQLDKCAPKGFINLYRRDNASGAYEALIPSKPPAGAPMEGYRLEVQGTSADGTRTVFRANAKLTSDAAATIDETGYQLYMHIRDPKGGCGQLRLVSFKENGVASTEAASAGTPKGPAEYRESRVARAVSEDGKRVFFTLGKIPGSNGPLYVRVNADQPQGDVSGGKCTKAAIDAGKGCTFAISGTTSAQFWTAAADGSRAIYSVGDELFEYDVGKAIKGEAASTPIAGEANGVAAASEDAARIYFVSEEEIDSEGDEGEPNLYLYESGKVGGERYRLVATLSKVQGLRFWGFEVVNPTPNRNGTRVTADGTKLAFVSSTSLTGYDNLDAVDDRPNLEVYLYDRASEAVRCISCNPSGARPSGREFAGASESVRVSAMMAPAENQSFAPRALSADGNRLFFESFESLLPRDVNEKADVYQWERGASAEACKAAGAELFVPASGGCLSLISSGLDESDSEFADASPDGSDVFIRTLSSLLPQDPGQVDVYVAREGGGFPIQLRKDPCEGEACPNPPPPPPPDTGVATQGPSTGNVPVKKPCPKGKVRNKKGKCVKKPGKQKGKKAKKKATKNKKGARR